MFCNVIYIYIKMSNKFCVRYYQKKAKKELKKSKCWHYEMPESKNVW